MNTLLVVSVVVIALCSIAITVFLAITMFRIKQVTSAVEILLKQLSNDAAVFGKIVSNISFMTEKISSPWFKLGTAFSSVVSSFMYNKFRKNQPKP